MFGPSIALGIGAKFVPLRKPRKLPGTSLLCAKLSQTLPLNFVYLSKKYQTLTIHGWYLGEVISEKYELEYGNDCLEMHVGAVQPGERAIVIDDLVATGGTLSAAIRLLGEIF